ncbi:TOG domain-containing protein [Entamoeba marina]
MNSLHDSVTLFQTLSIGPTPLNLQQFKVAEQQYNQLKLNPQNFIYLHVSVLQQSDSSAIRKYVITQLYTHVIRGRNAMYITLQPNIRDELNKLLLVLMDKETDKLTLHGYQNAIAICCSQLASLKIFWDGALNACFQWISGSNILLQTHAISLLSDIVLYLTDEQFKLYYQKLIEIIPLGLNSQEPLIIVNSVALFKSVLENCDDGEQVMTVTNFFPLIISNANKFMQTPNSDDHQQSILESIEELFEEVNYHLEEYVPVTLQLCFQICVTDKIDFEVQSTAFEVILTIADELPKTLKKNKEIQTIFLQIILKYLQTIGDSPAWFKSEEESDDFPYFYLASEGFSRFITSVGCSSILNNIIQNSQQLTSSPKWSDRLSLLICFTTILSDCKHTMKKYIKQVMEIVLKFQQDPYPRVRHQLIIFNNKLLVSYPKDKQSYLSIFLQIIYSGLSDEIPRIQSRSCDFLSNLVDLFPAKSIKDQFQPMLQKIQPLLMSSDINVIAESLCSLSYINTKMKYDFLPYFNDFYPILEKFFLLLIIMNNILKLKVELLNV